MFSVAKRRQIANACVMGALGDKLMGRAGQWMMGRVVPRTFLKHLQRHLRTVAPEREDELIARIKERFNHHVERDADLVVDGPSDGMLAMSATVHGAYEVLVEEIGDPDRTIAYLQHVFGESLEHMSSLATALLFRAKDDPMDLIEQFLRKWTISYGDTMNFEFTREGSEAIEMRITKCFMKEYFDRHGIVSVTEALCGGDTFWMNEIDPALMGIRCKRTCTMPRGAEADVFRIERTNDPLAENYDVVFDRSAPRPKTRT